jgi:ABC-type phosphate transport system substrate-binding protein
MPRALLAGALLLLAPVAVQAESFKLIVQAANPGTSIKKADALDLFLKRATKWGNGVPAVPVDQSITAPVRARFSDVVLGLPTIAVQQHWQRQMAAGKGAPPPVKTSDEQVIAFVRDNPGAIGYVSEAAVLPEGVKELKLVE